MSIRKAAGGHDPRYTTRQHLLDKGAPLMCARQKAKSKPAGSFCVFRSQRVAERKRTQAVLAGGLASADQEMRQVRDAWNALPAEQMASYVTRAQAEHSRKEPQRLTAEEEITNPTHDMGWALLWGLNSKDSPLAEDRFRQAALEAVMEENLPGSRRYCGALRDTFVEGLFIPEQGAEAKKASPPHC